MDSSFGPYIPYLYNPDTSVKRTLGFVPLVSKLKRFERNLFLLVDLLINN